MSYIFEALKRSQQEREFNQAPTLASVMAADKDDDQLPTINLWLVAAFLLAFVSMAVAIYAVTLLRTKDATNTLTQTTEQTNLPVATALHKKTSPLSEVTTVPQQSTSKPTPTTNDAPAPPSTPSNIVASTSAPLEKSKPRLESAPEPLVPRTSQQTTSKSKTSSNQVKAKLEPVVPTPTKLKSNVATKSSKSEPITTSSARKITTRLSKPNKEKSTPQPKERDVEPVTRRTSKKVVKIPTDVTESVEVFKQKLRNKSKTGSKVTKSSNSKTNGSTTSVGRKTETARAEEVPSIAANTLPSAEGANLPQNNLTVHVYSKSPSRRFVILNSQRLREGNKAANGLRVESIWPDGVVLEFEKRRYFKHR